MSEKVKDQPISTPGTGLFYTAESLRFARNLLSELEHEIKERAKELTRDAGRNTITEQDMRRAADDILGPVDGVVDDPVADDAR